MAGIGPHSIGHNRYQSRDILHRLLYRDEDHPDSAYNTQKITQAVMAQLPASQIGNASRFISAVQGLLRGMNPKDQHDFIKAMQISAQSTNATTIVDNAADTERLRNAEILKRLQDEARAREEADRAAANAAKERKQRPPINFTGAEAGALMRALGLDVSDIARWMREKARRSGNRADMIAAGIIETFVESSSKGRMQNGVVQDGYTGSEAMPVSYAAPIRVGRDPAVAEFERAWRLEERRRESEVYGPPAYVDPRSPEEKDKAAEAERRQGVVQTTPGIVTRVDPKSNAPFSVRLPEKGDTRTDAERREAERIEREGNIEMQPGAITRLDPKTGAPRSERLPDPGDRTANDPQSGAPYSRRADLPPAQPGRGPLGLPRSRAPQSYSRPESGTPSGLPESSSPAAPFSSAPRQSRPGLSTPGSAPQLPDDAEPLPPLARAPVREPEKAPEPVAPESPGWLERGRQALSRAGNMVGSAWSWLRGAPEKTESAATPAAPPASTPAAPPPVETPAAKPAETPAAPPAPVETPASTPPASTPASRQPSNLLGRFSELRKRQEELDRLRRAAAPNATPRTNGEPTGQWVESQLTTEGGNLRVLTNPVTKERILFDFDNKTPISGATLGAEFEDKDIRTLNPDEAAKRLEALRVAEQERAQRAAQADASTGTPAGTPAEVASGTPSSGTASAGPAPSPAAAPQTITRTTEQKAGGPLVTERAPDGTERTIFTSNEDGTRVVRTTRPDGTVEHTVVDRDGNATVRSRGADGTITATQVKGYTPPDLASLPAALPAAAPVGTPSASAGVAPASSPAAVAQSPAGTPSAAAAATIGSPAGSPAASTPIELPEIVVDSSDTPAAPRAGTPNATLIRGRANMSARRSLSELPKRNAAGVVAGEGTQSQERIAAERRDRAPSTVDTIAGAAQTVQGGIPRPANNDGAAVATSGTPSAAVASTGSPAAAAPVAEAPKPEAAKPEAVAAATPTAAPEKKEVAAVATPAAKPAAGPKVA